MDKLPVQSAEPLRVPLLLLPHSIGSAWQCSGWSRPFSIPPGPSWQVLPCPLLVRDFLAEQMSLRGITFHTEQSPEAITKSNDGLLSLKTNKETIDGFSHVMFATGRKPNTKVVTATTTQQQQQSL